MLCDMSTYTQILYQIVFHTKYTRDTLDRENRVILFKYIWKILEGKKCVAYQINGVDNHIHIATHLHPSVSLASLVKDIKVSSAIWIREQKLFPNFIGWQRGYGAFTYSQDAKKNLINYIRRQEWHHKKITYRDEYLQLLRDFNIAYDERYLF
jgi:putative transposase